MSQRVRLPYYALGNYDGLKLQKEFPHIQSTRANAANILTRNRLSFERPLKESYTLPEYKELADFSGVNKDLNSYLSLPGQFQYKQDINIGKSCDFEFGIQRAKKRLALQGMDDPDRKMCNYAKTEQDKMDDILNKKMELKETILQNILSPNTLHLTASTKCSRRVEPPSLNVDFDEVKQRCFLESKDAPEYMRNYDREKLGVIDDYFVKTNENKHILSRFGSWITLPPGCKDRSKAIEKLSHGTYETSILTPQWMNISNDHYDREKARKENPFKIIPRYNNCKDNTKVALLVDKNQAKVKPPYLCSAYERYSEGLDY